MKIFVLGGSGRTGLLFLRLARQAGHEVKALVRAGREGAVAGTGATVVVGAIDDLSGVVSGVDVVVSALGPSAADLTVCSRAARAVIAAGAKRYVSVSGAGVDAAGDAKNFEARMVSRVIKWVGGAAVADKEVERAALAASTLDYTLVRPPRLVSGRPKGSYRVELRKGAPSSTLDREDLARFLLEVVEHPDRYRRQAPFVAW